jgi:hypothetical protein
VFVQQQFFNFGRLLVNFGRRLARMEAGSANTRILSRNRRYSSDPLRPLQKYVSFPPTTNAADLTPKFFDFHRLMVMAIIWHSPYVGRQL